MLSLTADKIRLVAFVLCWSCLWGAANAASVELPTALCYFTSDEPSYLGAERVQKIAELVQAELMTSNRSVRWVDRTQIETALDELQLQAFGKVDATGALRLGHWLKADLLLKVHYARDAPLAWTIRWETIDLATADVLTSGVLKPVQVQAADDLASEANRNVLGQSLSRGLAAAILQRQNIAQRVLIAPLHFRNADSLGRLDYLEQDLRHHLEKRNAAQSTRRFLQFPRAGDAIEEANLIASGLVSTDLKQWQRIADYYVWGSFQEVESSGVPFSEVTIELTLELWNGRDDTLRLTHRGKVRELDRLIEQAVAELEEHATTKQTAAVSPEIRKQIAERIRREISDLQEWVIQVDTGDFGRPADDWLRRWRQCIRLLAIGAFLDPTNEPLRRELLVETTRADLRFTTLPGNREFWRVWQSSDAWKAYCQQFGYDYRHVSSPKLKHRPGLTDNRMQLGVLHMFLKKSDDLLVAVSGDTSLHGNPVPPGDVPGDVLREWQDEIARDHIARIRIALEHPAAADRSMSWLFRSCEYYIRNPKLRAEAIELLWPVLLKSKRPTRYFNERVVRETFATIGRPAIADSLISAAKEISTAETELAPRAAMPAPRATNRGLPIEPLAPVKKVPMRPRSLAKHFYVQRVHALAHAEDRLWISVEGQFRSLAQGYALFTSDEQVLDVHEFKGLTNAGSAVTDILPEPGGLWLTLDGDGICHVTPRTGAIQRFGERDGLPSSKLFAIAKQGNTLYASGGAEQRGVFASLTPPAKTWAEHKLSENRLRNLTLPSSCAVMMACSKEWQAVYCHHGKSLTQILLRGASGGDWRDIGDQLRQEHPEFSHFSGSWRIDVSGLAWSHDLLWIATSRGLLAYNPGENKFSLVQPTPWEFRTLQADGERLWLTAVPFTDRYSHDPSNEDAILLAFNLNSRSWETQIPLPYKGTPRSVAVSPSKLWIGMGAGVDILAIDRAALGMK